MMMISLSGWRLGGGLCHCFTAVATSSARRNKSLLIGSCKI